MLNDSKTIQSLPAIANPRRSWVGILEYYNDINLLIVLETYNLYKKARMKLNP